MNERGCCPGPIAPVRRSPRIDACSDGHLIQPDPPDPKARAMSAPRGRRQTSRRFGGLDALGASLSLGIALSSCAVPSQMLAGPSDLADYRTFRAAAYEGARLALAHQYIDRHPRGAWAEEVRGVFDVEEPAWFELAKTSRWRARAYLVDMPWGPHADAARALLNLFDGHPEDVDTLELMAKAQLMEATLNAESATRKRVGELVLEELAALLDKTTWSASLDVPPAMLEGVLRGPARSTWGWGGTKLAWERTDEVFFVVPTPGGPLTRDAAVHFQLKVERGRVTQGTIQGANLFVRWAEAMQGQLFDPDNAGDRTTAASEIVEVLGGALEGQLPSARCRVNPIGKGGILTRACDGWLASVRMGSRTGDTDVIEIRAGILR